MVSEAVVTSGLETLPPRPPTPPREKSLEVEKQNQLLSRPSLDPRRSLHTPPDYSPYSSDLSNPTSRRTRKKVGFSSQAEYRDAPTYLKGARKQPTPASVPAAASSTANLPRPLKSILKPSPPAVLNPLDPSAGTDEATRHANIVTMLESTTKQLAGTDRASKLDAYSVLVRALKASNNLPDRIALQAKMSLFTQFIQRDVTSVSDETGELDSSLSNHASALLITFLNFPAIASSISNEFGVFIMDHCIRSFENAAVPKDVVRHLMQIVASQDFPAKVMSADRVGRLVSSLHRIEEHLKGKSIIMSRILIYRKLIKQSKPHMITHADWLLDLFTDMLSSMKEIRATAIALGLEASFTIAKDKHLSKRVMEILELTVDDTKYIQYYVGRLKAMSKSKDVNDSSVVPQIWSVILLLLRCPVTKWDFFGPWLEVIQVCFNKVDLQTKSEAFYAWNRLVYCIQLHDPSFSKVIATIRQPYESQLKRKKLSDELRRVVLGSLCNLYYYTFKPNTSEDQISNFWDSCIPQLINPMVSPELLSKTPDATPSLWQNQIPQATQVLTALFNSTTPRIWKEDRIADSPLVKADELPALDPKWVRRNASKVFSVVGPLLTKTYLDLADEGSATAKLWKTLVGSVAVAASKEVKVSTDTAVFMAHTLTFLFRLWSQGLAREKEGEETSQRFYKATHAFISTLVSSLGPLPFTEKQLSMGTQNTFVPVATPSHRPGKNQGVTRTPLHHLFSILSSLPPNTKDDDDLANLVQSMLAPFLVSRSHKAKIDLAYELMHSLPMDTISPSGPWVAISNILSESLQSSQTSFSSSSSTSQPPIGHGYREIINHLEKGARSTPGLPWTKWQSLFQILVTRASNETGEAGCALAVIEPLSKSVLDILANSLESSNTMNLFRFGTYIISVAKQPRDRQAVEAARRRLWGTSISGPRSASFDIYDNLYKLINHLLTVSYQRYSEFETEGIVVPLLTEVAGFLSRCNQLLVLKTLVSLQDSIGFWIQDKEARYNNHQSAHVSEAVKLLWTRICNIFIEADNLEQVQLDTIEPLLCSAFESRHRQIVSTVTVMWNRAFEQADEVQYPERLKAVLLSLHPYVDIVLPGFDFANVKVTGQEPVFINSQDDLEAAAPAIKTVSKASPPADRRSSSRRSRSNTPRNVKPSVPTSSQQKLELTPRVSRLKSARRSATPRLKHNDSQIQFAAIASSSPLHTSDESQILTERQREVREKQHDNAALFSELRSSVKKGSTELHSSKKASSPDISLPEKAVTPKSHRSFEDYVSSTPTPRRGQAVLVDDNDHEMTDDIPSSPPDPRRYPLVPEINKPLSSSSSVLDEWQFTSSPISGSPLHNRSSTSNEADVGSLHQVRDLPDRDAATNGINEESRRRLIGDENEQGGIEDEADGVLMGKEDSNDVLPPVALRSTTPPKALKLKPQETPKSDNEVFVDALTSPNPRTPRDRRALARASQLASTQLSQASQPKDRSFDASDVDERSLLRLVVELDSQKCDPRPSDATRVDAELDEHDRSSQDRGGSPSLDCIAVNMKSNKSNRKTKKSKSGEPLPIMPPTPVEADLPQETDQIPKKKRKRGGGKTQESGNKKRRHSRELEIDIEPGSQLLPINDIASLELSERIGGERPTSFLQESSDQSRYLDGSSPISDTLDSADNSMDELEAVNMQIVQEASQNTQDEMSIVEPLAAPVRTDDSQRMAPGADITMEEVHAMDSARAGQESSPGVHIAEGEATVASQPESITRQKIMDSLRGSLALLRTSALSRDDVNEVEDMFMDLKRELYNAEFRGRK
ncbi:Rap1-interacting factor 1 N terminal-domain-containing protein [Truncatella angustata]|uniref:Rap1-interacting factor 1 N terminal-domain-containing protein n=1 Tax=Truncatella angustata TaxID=152316 RepID=A0A9P8ZZI4_9PEZI|nr:Rap1-interacting factor 1 N terminal-domain-containing protein [Truncatella angustata]KAH6657287.1 Rap1-interacting factor 1 N terminal-domain-containing protein [Truncatella angustata]